MNEKRTISGWKGFRTAVSSVSCALLMMGMMLPLYNVMIGDFKLGEGSSFLSVMDSGSGILMLCIVIATFITSFKSKALFLLCDSVFLLYSLGAAAVMTVPVGAGIGSGFYMMFAGWCGLALSIILCIPSDYKKETVMNTSVSENQDASVMKKETDTVRTTAEPGNGAEQFNRGVMYAKGNGVEQDYKKAAECFQLAADQGNCKAQNNLGWLYANGKGVEKNEELAVQYYKLAADQGFSAAQYNVGIRYEQGRGTKKNTEMAAKYYQLAADQGHSAARTALERIAVLS